MNMNSREIRPGMVCAGGVNRRLLSLLMAEKKTSSNFSLPDVFRRGEKRFFCFCGIIGSGTIVTLVEKSRF
jgi:hypothetical protein